MKYKNILHALQQMSPEELEQAALVYNPFYGRLFAVEAFGCLGHITEQADGRKVVVVAKEALA